MSSGLLNMIKVQFTIIRCGTMKKVAVEPPPRIFGFMPLPSVALRSAASFFLCKDGFFFFENQVNVETMKLMTSFKCGPTKVLGL
jgi:hypothetical protein